MSKAPDVTTDDDGDLAKLRAVINRIEREASDARASIEQAKRAREELKAAPLGRGDTLQLLCDSVDHVRGRLPDVLKRHIAQMSSRPSKNAADWGLKSPLVCDDAGTLAIMLVGLLSGPVKDGLHQLFAELDETPSAGPPLAERAAMILALDEKIEQSEARLMTLKSTLGRSGLRFGGSLF